jgi:hypothetical protein
MKKKPTGSRKGASKPEDRATDPRRLKQGNRIDFEMLAPGRSWAEVWNAFVKKYRSWWNRVGGGGPVYALPREIIKSLAESIEPSDSSHRASKPLIDVKDAKAERDFLRICKRFQSVTVGVWDGQPINYPLLTESAIPRIPPDSLIPDEWLVEGRSRREVKLQLEKLYRQLGQHHQQMLGYVGWLTLNKQYRDERSAIRDRWASLPDRPSLPIDANVADRPSKPVVSIEPNRRRVLGDELAQVLTDFGRFMRKWRINRMVTWELPYPQGPMDQIPLGMAVLIQGPEHRVDTIPSYFDTPSSVDVRKAVRRGQQQAATDDGIEQAHPVTDISPRDGHASRYESALRLWLIEQSIRKRYGSPKGLVARLLPVFADLINVSDHRVQQLRHLYKEALDAEV